MTDNSRESDDSPTTKVTGTVTASASHNGDVIVEYEGGGDEVVASLSDDNTDLPHSHARLLPNTMFENVQFGPPPMPGPGAQNLGPEDTGDVGSASASVQLTYSPAGGWQLEGHDYLYYEGLTPDVKHGLVLSYEIARAGLMVLYESDTQRFIEELGEDLPQLLTRIAAGYGTKWDGRNVVGVLTSDAREAEEELEERINETEIILPTTWYARQYFELCSDEIEKDQTPQHWLDAAEFEDVRIWGGAEAVEDFMSEVLADRAEAEAEADS